MPANALKLQNVDVSSNQNLLQRAMTTMPIDVLHSIAFTAGLIWDEPNAGDEHMTVRACMLHDELA